MNKKYLQSNRLIVISICFWLLLVAKLSWAQGAMPVHVPLRQAGSAHFLYIYEAPLEPRMPGIIQSCEDAYDLLTPVFHWQPRQKTVVMVSDAMDIHNGWATVYPRPMILIYTADVPPESTIFDPGDYMRRTIFHEFAHILSIDAQYGVDAALTDIFGRVLPGAGDPLSLALTLMSAPPGLLAPDWYKEGLPTWAETEFVGPGRGRSSRVDMIMRMSVADYRLLHGNQWFLELPEWPYGDAAYLYGLKTMQYIHEHYGVGETERNVPGRLSETVARSFMFGFNSRSINVTGKTFQTLAREAMQAEDAKQVRRMEILKSMPLTRTRRLTPQRLIVTEPRFGPDGKAIFFSGREEADRNTLFRFDADAAALTKLRSVRTTIPLFADITPAPDRSHLYYTRLEIHGRDRLRNELHRLDTTTHRSRRVTGSGRYRYPCISPDGLYLAAVVNRNGEQSLVQVPLAHAGEQAYEKTMVNAPPNFTLVDPVFSPDGDAILYVQADEKGSELRRVARQSADVTSLLNWPCMVLSPVFHPVDKSLIFVSDKNGVYNLYRMPVGHQGDPVAITHVLGGIFNPDISPDGKQIVAAAYDAYGYYLTLLDYEQLKPLGPLPAIDSGWQSLEKNLKAINAVEHHPADPQMQTRPYHSISHMGFDYWSPWMTFSQDGLMGGLSATFSEPTQFHNLSLLAGAESNYGAPVGALIYQYSGLYPLISLYTTTMPEYYDDLVVDTDNLYYDYNEQVNSAGVAVSVPLLRVDWQASWTVGYEFSDRSVIEKSEDDYQGQSLQTSNLFEGQSSALWTRLDFFNATAYGRSHSYEDGRYLTATVEWADESLGSDINTTRFRGDWTEYVRIPWFENHTLKLEAVYAQGSGDQTAQGLFGLGGYQTDFLNQGLNRSIDLRGYTANYHVGDEVVKGGIAYRFPIYRFYKNIGATTPFYLHQIFGELFYEAGRASTSEWENEDGEWLRSVGTEVNFSTTLFRLLPIATGVGAVYAIDYEKRIRDGEDEDDFDKFQIYLSIKTTVNF